MNKEDALKKIWDYMHLGHHMKKADVIFVLGSRDTSVADRAVQLYKEGWAPCILLSGSGSIHNHKPGREKFVGTTEADVFADRALQQGVPKQAILIENKSQNTGENYTFSIKLLEEKGISVQTIIAVQKPYMERRTYATGKIYFPETELIVTSPQYTLDEYRSLQSEDVNEWWIHTMVGDLQRIKEYPARGFQIYQEIPHDVLEAYDFLVDIGYNQRLIA